MLTVHSFHGLGADRLFLSCCTSTFKDAVDAILDYYFGDPSKMNPSELLAFEEE